MGSMKLMLQFSKMYFNLSKNIKYFVKGQAQFDCQNAKFLTFQNNGEKVMAYHLFVAN
jgi:hypothetical protein